MRICFNITGISSKSLNEIYYVMMNNNVMVVDTVTYYFLAFVEKAKEVTGSGFKFAFYKLQIFMNYFNKY